MDKTQVFYRCKNDHVTHRILHVQMLSRIARDVASCLGLNVDLVEAIALGHDVGHAPFGHEGETALAGICEEWGLPPFQHNVHSVRLLRDIERWNLCLRTYDGIFCHDGEVHDPELSPRFDKDWSTLDEEISAKKKDRSSKLTPMTHEGCIVRMCDAISYIGRDIEDAISVRLIKRDDIPRTSLGCKVGDIVWNLVTDLVKNSEGKNSVSFSREVSDELRSLKQFAADGIYNTNKVKREREAIGQLFKKLTEAVLHDIRGGNDETSVRRHHMAIVEKGPKGYRRYRKEPPEQIAIDYVAGMTDRFFETVAKQALGESGLALLPQEYFVYPTC